MKYTFFLIVITFMSCKTMDVSSLVSSNSIQVDNCKKEGVCKIEVLKNKDYKLIPFKEGRFHPEIIDGNNTMVKYSYEVANPNGYEDGFQSETLYFLLNKETKKELVNGELQNIKLLFGKNCYCKDIQGFYKVEKGSFSIKSSEITIVFTIPKVGERQLVKKVHFTLE